MKNTHWFTLTELVIGLTISSIVLLVVFSFMANVMSEFWKSQKKTWFITTLYDFTGKVNEYREVYENIYLIDNPGNKLDSILLYSTGSTWVLFGIVASDTGMIDPLVNHGIYWEKLIGYKELTPLQVIDVIFDQSNAYTYEFFGDKIFKDIYVESFEMTSYNSWTLVNLDLGILVYYKPDLDWTDMDQLIPENIFDIILTF